MSNKEYFKNLIDQVKDSDRDAYGCEKDCFYVKDADVAILKSSMKSLHLKASERQLTIARLNKLGLRTPKILFHTKNKEHYFEIQEKAKGDVLFKNMAYMTNKAITYEQTEEYNNNRIVQLLSAPDEQYKDYAKSIFIGSKIGLWSDLHNNNVFYDENNGFTFIDLPANLPNYTLKSLKYMLGKPLGAGGEYFAKKLFSPFNQCPLRDDRKFRNTIMNNLINHKLLNGLNLAISEFDSNIQNDVFTNSTKNNIEDILLGATSPFRVETDLNTKFYLIHFGIIKPNPEEKKFLIDIDKAYGPDAPDELLSFYYGKGQDSKESINLLKKCVDATIINNIPATEYFTNLDTSSIINNTYNKSSNNFSSDDFEL